MSGVIVKLEKNVFLGRNPDGSIPFTFSGDGFIQNIDSLTLIGWMCYGPLGPEGRPWKTITDEQIIDAMRKDINAADGGYIIDTSPELAIAAGRAVLALRKWQ
jgi:hypothetical protein